MQTPLKRQIASSIRGMILTGAIQSGSRIKEEELAEQFGVSRGPIRDVFIELGNEGLMQAAPYKGLTVRDLPTAKAREIYVRMRREIEELALRDSFPHWTDSSRKELDKILVSMRIAAEVDDLQDFVQHDMAFHLFIIEQHTADNLSPIWMPLISTMALPYSRHRDLMESYREHEAIVDQLKQGNLDLAVAMLLKHIR